MSRAVVAEFATAEALLGALRAARETDHQVLDAFSPYPLGEVARELAPDWRQVRLWAFAAAVAVAAFGWGIQWWSQARSYPLNTGSRPLNSWPVYILTIFEVAVLAAAVVGAAVFLIKAGLPRLVHPVFEIADFDRASQDRFFLALQAPERDAPGEMRLIELLMSQGALAAHGADL